MEIQRGARAYGNSHGLIQARFRDCILKRRALKRFVLLLSSLLFSLLLVLLLEAFTRILKPEINFQDTERSLLRERAFGDTYGWRPEATGISFGKRVVIDSHGFRKMNVPDSYEESWLILGDSVTFGVGVETEETFAQLLQYELPHARIWNTSVIGYNTRNYRDVLYNLTAGNPNEVTTKLERVLLFFCLNDIDLGQVMEMDFGAESNLGFRDRLLIFLRRHSKFYILMKNKVSDRSRFYFIHDQRLYTDEGMNFTESMRILSEVNDYLRNRGVRFTVVILPYEYQLRAREEQNLIPQRRLAAFLSERGIDFIDAYDALARSGQGSADNYLYADFGHFSKKGHKVVFELLKERLKGSTTAR